MDLKVHSKNDKEERQPSGGPSFLGRGMLERARATTLALLGGTTAVGLAMVALALNQGWPLIAGSPIPLIAPQHQDVARATIAAGLPSDLRRERAPVGDRHGSPASQRDAGGHSGGTSPALPTAPRQSADFVVVPATPVKSHRGPTHGPAEEPQPIQAVQAPPPQPTAESPAAALPTSSPATPAPPPPVEPASPDPTVAEVPDDSDPGAPTWSHGHGYGRDGDWGDDDRGWDDDSQEWSGGGHDHWHGHHDD
jgi:hypothetical protein